jgi:ABC-type multidrug transport system ATPase subunit
MGIAVEVSDLHKSYGPVRAVDGVSFTVEEGEIFGMVGPNGAGKTTTIECVEGLRRPDRGTVRVLGLDPRRDGYELRLTTHFMEEAERLCDRVAIIDHGKIVALDTPENLIRSLGAEQRVVFTVDGQWDDTPLRGMPGVTRVEHIGERTVVYGRGEGLVGGVVGALERMGVRFRDLRTEQPTLEDVFLALTGKEMRELATRQFEIRTRIHTGFTDQHG